MLLRVFRPIVFRAVRHWPIAAGVVAAIWTLETGQPLLVAACSAVLVGSIALILDDACVANRTRFAATVRLARMRWRRLAG